MEIIRKIGKYQIMVNPSEPSGIYLTEDVIEQLNITNRSDEVSIDKKIILDFLSEKEYIPLTLQWEIIDKCNFSCEFCYIVNHVSNKLQRFEDIKHHIKDLINSGLLFCILTGGEPTLHPDFKEIYRFLKENGVIVDIFTNGLNLNNELIDLFEELPPSTIEISLYSLNDTKLLSKYGVKEKNAVSKILTNILELKQRGIYIKCKTFSNSITDEDISEISNWCKNHDIDYYTYNDIKDAYDGSSKKEYQSQSFKYTPKEIKEYICLPCDAKRYGCYIDSAFSMSICANIQLPDFTESILKQGVEKSLNNLKKFMYKFQDSKIVGSCDKDKCATCIAYAIPKRNLQGEIVAFQHPN